MLVDPLSAVADIKDWLAVERVGEVKHTGDVATETVVLILSVSAWLTLTADDNKLLAEVTARLTG